MITILLAFLFLYVWMVLVSRERREKYEGIDTIPGPPALPIIGNLLNILGSTNWKFRVIQDFHKTYGNVYRIWSIQADPVVIVADTEVLEVILNSQKYITKSRMYKHLLPWLGTGLLTSTGDKWRERRKLITPSFHFNILEKFVPAFNSCSSFLIKKLSQEVGKNSMNIYKNINLCAVDIICETAMGISVNAQTAENKYTSAVAEYLRVLVTRETTIYAFDVIFNLAGYGNRCEELLKIMDDFTIPIIKERKRKIEESEIGKETFTKTDTESKEKLAFLDLLLKVKDGNGNALTMEAIREEVNTFMFEGHDTVTAALSFTLFEIARHPEIQEKIVQELKTIFAGEYDGYITYKQLQEMNYLNLVIKEALRLYPSVHNFLRRITEKISVGKYEIPKNATLAINAYAIHRNPDHFPDPEKFIPERFTAENSVGRHPFCYIPFSAGPRNCIGQKFAVLEMKTVLAKILMNYELLPAEPKHEVVMCLSIILKSSSGVFIKIKKRDSG